MNKRLFAIGLPVVIIAIAAGMALASNESPAATEAVELQTEAPTYSDTESLVRAADDVVLARVTDVEDGRTVGAPGDPSRSLRTELVTLTIGESFKGTASDTVVVEQEAFTGGGTPVVVQGIAKLDVDDEGIFFLSSGQSPEFPYSAILNTQSQYLVSGSDRNDVQTPSQDPLAMRLAAFGPFGIRCELLSVTNNEAFEDQCSTRTIEGER
jgi:hypothetical protein